MNIIEKLKMELIEKKNEVSPDGENKTYYYNSNDGTEFDWKINNRTCEFGIPNSQGKIMAVGVIKKNGNIEIMVWDNKDKLVHDYVMTTICPSYASRIKSYLLKNRDNSGIWDGIV